MVIKLCDFGTTLGTRDLGEKVRRLLLDALEHNLSPIEISFEGIFMVSSSFADECFGKLVEGIGKDEFKKCFRIKELNDDHIRMVLNNSVRNRLCS